MPQGKSHSEMSDDGLQRKLRSAMEYATVTCVLGADNKIEDIERTNGWTFVQKYRYHNPGRYLKLAQGQFTTQDHAPNAYLTGDVEERKLCHTIKQWYYHVDDQSNINFLNLQLIPLAKLNPLFDPVFKLKPGNKNVLYQALFAIATRYGNCGIRASLISKYCWEHPEGIHRIEGITMGTFDHVVVVVNRSGDLKNPDTWGNAWVIDNWYKEGLIFPANEFKEKIKHIKQYYQEQNSQLKKINISLHEKTSPSSQDIQECVWEINPKEDLYPSYSTSMRVENYYIVANGYPSNMLEQLKTPKNNHVNMEINWQKQEEKKANTHASVTRSSSTTAIHSLLSVPAKAVMPKAISRSEQKSTNNKKPSTVCLPKLFKSAVPLQPLSREYRNKIGNEYLHSQKKLSKADLKF